MTLQAIFKQKQAKAALGGMLVTLLAWQLCPFQFMVWLSDLSYDLPFLFTAPGRIENVVLVEMDETSHTDLKQTYGERWDRRCAQPGFACQQLIVQIPDISRS